MKLKASGREGLQRSRPLALAARCGFCTAAGALKCGCGFECAIESIADCACLACASGTFDHNFLKMTGLDLFLASHGVPHE